LPEESPLQPNDWSSVHEDDLAVPAKPDKYTKAFIPGGAPNQVFMFDRLGLKYGTDDKGHAASLILSVLLLALLLCLFFLGTLCDPPWISDALQIIGTAFTFVAGVAVGKSVD